MGELIRRHVIGHAEGRRIFAVRRVGHAFIRQYFLTVVESSLEAAKIDGSSDAQGRERFILQGFHGRFGRQVGGKCVTRRVRRSREVEAAEVERIPERQVGGESMIRADVRAVAHRPDTHGFGYIALFRDGDLIAGVAALKGGLFGAKGFRPRPIGDLGQVGDAGVSERGANGQVGIGINLSEGYGAQLSQREHGAARQGVKNHIRLPVVRDTFAPEGVFTRGVGIEGFIRARRIQAALAEHPAEGRMGFAVVTEQVGLLGAGAEEEGRHGCVEHLGLRLETISQCSDGISICLKAVGRGIKGIPGGAARARLFGHVGGPH